MPQAYAYAIDSPTGRFSRTTIERREPGPTEVLFDIAYAGICHSDIHTARGEWGAKEYPVIPGHEIAGIVREVGTAVTKYKVGDRVGVGCFIDSCGECEQCKNGWENFCEGPGGTIWTYTDTGRDGKPTYGGYSTAITVEQDYVLRIPDGIPLHQAAPLLCAGVTLYSPLKRFGAGPGKRVAIVGMGGLGHMGVQIAAAMGAEVAVISHGRSKEADAYRFGATEFYATSEPGALDGLGRSFDLIVTTVSSSADLTPLVDCLTAFGTLVDVGLPEHPVQLSVGNLCTGNRTFAGSNIGGIGLTQEMLDFCAEHGLGAQVEVIGGEDINDAYDRVVNSDVRYRFVIDTSTFTA